MKGSQLEFPEAWIGRARAGKEESSKERKGFRS